MTKRQAFVAIVTACIAGVLAYIFLDDVVTATVQNSSGHIPEGVGWIVIPLARFTARAGVGYVAGTVVFMTISYYFWHGRDQLRRAQHSVNRTGPRKYGPNSS